MILEAKIVTFLNQTDYFESMLSESEPKLPRIVRSMFRVLSSMFREEAGVHVHPIDFFDIVLIFEKKHRFF